MKKSNSKKKNSINKLVRKVPLFNKRPLIFGAGFALIAAAFVIHSFASYGIGAGTSRSFTGTPSNGINSMCTKWYPQNGSYTSGQWTLSSSGNVVSGSFSGSGNYWRPLVNMNIATVKVTNGRITLTVKVNQGVAMVDHDDSHPKWVCHT